MLDQRRLNGSAVLVDGRPAGYSCFRLEGGKAIIGEVFLQPAERLMNLQRVLLGTTIMMASRHSGVRRVEGQLVSLAALPDVQVAVPGELQVYPRCLMVRESRRALPAAGPVRPGLRFTPWTDSQLQTAAELIALAYIGHVDASIHEECRSTSGAQRCLQQTINGGGSGRFLISAGVVARQASGPRLAGICLGSMIGDHVGHITQLCVAPDWSGRGVGTELLRKTLGGFRRAGCETVSLTVTASNERAVRIHERMGFRTLASFPAFVLHPV